MVNRHTTQALFDHDLCYPLVKLYKKEQLHPLNKNFIEKWNTLFFTWSHWVPYTKQEIKKLDYEIQKSEKIVLMYDACFGNSIKRLVQQRRDLKRFKSIFQNINEVCYMTQFPCWDLFSKNKRKFPYHASPMIDTVFDEKRSDNLFKNYNPKEIRKNIALISGSSGTELRKKTFIELRKEFNRYEKISLIEPEMQNQTAKNDFSVFWATGENTLSFNSYIDIMRDSDFVVCLPGTYWTPRPVESTACGAIPILGEDYLHSYGIPFEDGINCIIIPKPSRLKNWTKVIKRIINLPPDQILRMRCNIHALRNSILLPEAYRKIQRKRFRCEKS